MEQNQTGISKTWVIIGILIVVFVIAAFFFRHKIKSMVAGGVPTPTPISEATVSPAATPAPLVRSDWSLEVLNGSGTSGLAKKIAGELQALGYPVVKTGNADKSNYPQTLIMVRKDLATKTDLVIADVKDVIKIASAAGELKEGTASARIIIGKDRI